MINNLKPISTANYFYLFDIVSSNIFISTLELNEYILYLKKMEISQVNNIEPQIEKFCKLHNYDVVNFLEEIERLNGIVNCLQTSSLIEPNLFFNNIDKNYINNSLSNLKQIIIQTTEKCNLDCYYCIDGPLYRNVKIGKKIDLEESVCISFIEYVLRFKTSNKNKSYNDNIFISFYGGEPLLNFKLINRVVNHLKSNSTKRFNIHYSITTNGILLNEYIDFLVENNFRISISFDGDRKANNYRVFHNGQESYQKVYDNVEMIRAKHPDFFEKNVSLFSVLHKKNKFADLYRYFISNFNKIPNISSLTSDEVNPDKREIFNSIYQNATLNSKELRTIKRISKNISDSNILADSVYNQRLNRTIYSLKDFIQIRPICHYPTGTCLPFSNRIYLNVKGEILPCEKASPSFVFGKCSDSEFEIYYDTIKSYYDEIIIRSSEDCKKCMHKTICDQCYFSNIDSFNNSGGLNCVITENDYIENVTKYIELNEIKCIKR